MKKAIIFVVIAFCATCIIGCSSTAQANGSSPLKMYHEDGYVYTVKDSETGVNYIVIDCGGGDNAICPRYNANGTLYTD